MCRTLVTSRLPIKKKRMGDQGSILKAYAAETYDLPLGLTSSAKGEPLIHSSLVGQEAFSPI